VGRRSQAPPDLTGSLTVGGAPASLTFGTPGQNAVLTFAGTAGQRVTVRATGVTIGPSTCCSTSLLIRKPDGLPLAFHKERKQDDNPPLDTTFFQKIRARGIFIPSELRDYAAALPTGSPFDIAASPQRMEEFFKDLFYDFLQETRTDTKTVCAYTQLVSIYTRVLRETTDWMGEDNRTGGPVGRLVSSAADAAGEVTILTFNHDLVIENEIYKRVRLRKRWCLEQGYGTFGNTCEFTGTRAQPQFPAHGPDCGHDRPLTLLKLHGSLNWYIRIRGERPSPRVLTGQSGSREVLVTRRRFVPAQLRWNIRSPGKGRKRWYTWPVIVPPIYAKQALIRAFMPAVWSDAQEALKESDRVLFSVTRCHS
jgi:hypothetical protein